MQGVRFILLDCGMVFMQVLCCNNKGVLEIKLFFPVSQLWGGRVELRPLAGESVFPQSCCRPFWFWLDLATSLSCTSQTEAAEQPLHTVCLIRNSLTFWEVCSFAFLLRHICRHYMKLQPARRCPKSKFCLQAPLKLINIWCHVWLILTETKV